MGTSQLYACVNELIFIDVAATILSGKILDRSNYLKDEPEMKAIHTSASRFTPFESLAQLKDTVSEQVLRLSAFVETTFPRIFGNASRFT